MIDLASCDKEPIHIPGAIQPHGALLAFAGTPENDAGQLPILHFSQNIQDFLGVPTGRSSRALLSDLFPGHAADLKKAARLLAGASPGEQQSLRVANSKGEHLDCALHRNVDGVFIAELERASEAPIGLPLSLRGSIAKLRRAARVAELCNTAAEEVRDLTGFDRVMVYRFDEEWNGEVIAERRRPDLEPFLGLHYPASDIPAQARRLYAENWLRVIGDVDYSPVPIEPTLTPGTGLPLDLSFSALRSVSPIHCEYLRNMGVRASMSISLMQHDKLWGLIACHHYAGPRVVSQSIRQAAELMGQSLSWHVTVSQHAEHAERSMAARRTELRLVESMTAGENFADGLCVPELLELTGASGAAVLFEGELRCIGTTPGEAALRQLCDTLSTESHDEVFHSERAPDSFPWLGPAGTGVLSVAISRSHGDYLLWFRPPYDRVVNWAGDPHQKLSLQDSAPRLSPRGSFALWKESVRGRALPWLPEQIEAASNLRRAVLFGVRRRAAQLSEINDQLTELSRTKDTFLATVGHELRTPLNAILGWTQLLRGGTMSPERSEHALDVIERNARAQSRLIEDLLDVSRIGKGKLSLKIQPVNLCEVVEAAIDSVALAAEAREIRLRPVLDSTLSLVLGDASRLQQVVWNLLTNAIKFTQRGGHVDVVLRRSRSDIELCVSDNGPGISKEFLPHVFKEFRQATDGATADRGGLGLGLSIVKHLVALHGGRVDAESAGPGLGATFRVVLPFAPLQTLPHSERPNTP